MDTSELTELIMLMRASGTDLADVEVRSAGGGLPKSVRETVSAFSNGSGGTVILGLDEREGFAPTRGFDASRIQASLAAMCADELVPPVRALIDIVMFEGHPLVVADIPELDPRYKPCYVKARGEYGGSFIRGGDGDRRLTDFEIHLLPVRIAEVVSRQWCASYGMPTRLHRSSVTASPASASYFGSRPIPAPTTTRTRLRGWHRTCCRRYRMTVRSLGSSSRRQQDSRKPQSSGS